MASISEVYSLLEEGDYVRSIQVLRSLLAVADIDAPERWIYAAKPSVARRLIALLRDLLSGYPKVTAAVPTMLYWQSDTGARHKLPLASEVPAPCSDMTFLGWSRPNHPLLQKTPGEQPVVIPSDKPVAALAIFACDAECYDLELPVITHEWWMLAAGAAGLQTAKHTLRASGRLLLPLPDAIDGAKLLQARLAQQPDLHPYFFLTTKHRIELEERAHCFLETLSALKHADDI